MKALSFIVLLLFVVSCNNSSEKVFVDQRDKKEYTYIEYGEKIWMSDELKYLDDDIYNSGAWVWNCTEESYTDCKSASGACKCVLYSWEAAKSSCPEGWRLPTVKEWKDLLSFYSGEKPDSPGLSKLNLLFDGHARMFNKFCIFDGNTYWTSDTSESKQMAVSIAIQHSKEGGIICNNEVSDIGNAFYVRCVKDKE